MCPAHSLTVDLLRIHSFQIFNMVATWDTSLRTYRYSTESHSQFASDLGLWSRSSLNPLVTLESGFSTRRLAKRTTQRNDPFSKPCFIKKKHARSNTRNVLFHGRGPGSAWDLQIMLNCCHRTKLPVSTGTEYL